MDYHEFCDFLLHGTVVGKSRKQRPHSSFPRGDSHRQHRTRKARRRRKYGAPGIDSDASGTDDGNETDSYFSTSDDGWGGSSDGDGGGGYGSGGSVDGLFERPPDPLMDAMREAMVKFAPSAERQQRVRDYLRGKDKNASGKV